jgi:hypothetical protein
MLNDKYNVPRPTRQVIWWHRLALLHLLELCLMGYLADSGTLSSPPHGNTYTPLYPRQLNSVNFTILKPSDWEQGHMISIKINGKGYDPGTRQHLK